MTGNIMLIMSTIMAVVIVICVTIYGIITDDDK